MTTPASARTALQRLLLRTPQDANDAANAAEVLACIAAVEKRATFDAACRAISEPCGACKHFHGSEQVCSAYLGTGDDFCTCKASRP